MTRALQNRLALANVKIKHGWQNLSLDSIEPKVEMELKRKRRDTSGGPHSDTSSSISDHLYPVGPVDSSPFAPMFSEDVRRSGGSLGYNKRPRPQATQGRTALNSQRRVKVRPQQPRAASWKSSYHLPQSSPAYHNRHPSHFSISHGASLSFVSESTVAEEHDRSSMESEEDDADLPVHSFQIHDGPQIRSSPPRTPPPSRSQTARMKQVQLKLEHDIPVTTAGGEEGAADLLMFLAASPSPAQPTPSRRSARTPRPIQAPSTPPAKSTPLPSSMMSTPGGTSAFLGFGATTPGMAFNFADYLNVTPSPGQGAWRTPGPAKTPLASKEARRRLNFDTLLPPGHAGQVQQGEHKAHGLGMELGGELVSSQ